MPWGHVDDKLHAHPKVDKAGVESMGLWVLALSWSQDAKTGGIITKARAVGICKSASKAAKYIASLVTAGFWEKHPTEPDTYIIHDFEDWNPAAAAAAAKQSDLAAKRRIAGKAGAAKRWQLPSDGDGKTMATASDATGKPTGVDGNADPAGGRSGAHAGGSGSSDLDPEDPDLGCQPGLSKTSTSGADSGDGPGLPRAAAERPSGPRAAQARSQDDDGCFGEAVRGWGRGVASVTGSPCIVPRYGLELDKLIAALCTVHPDVEGRAEASTRVGAEFAKSGREISVHSFVTWLNSGRKPLERGAHPARTGARSPASRAIEPLRPVKAHG